MVKIELEQNKYIDAHVSFNKKELYNEINGIVLYCSLKERTEYGYKMECYSNTNFKANIIELQRKNTKLENKINDLIEINKEKIKELYLTNDYKGIITLVKSFI